MKLLIFIIVLITPIQSTFADLGLPNIQAIARVELQDGKVIEGMILLGKGGYNYTYHSDAFCVAINNNYQLFPMNLNFTKFTPNSYRTSQNKVLEVYYAKNTSRKIRPTTTVTLEEDKNNKILKKTFSKEETFILKKSISLHTKLPLDLHLAYTNKTNGQILIEIDKIKVFSLVKDPSQKWKEYIETSVKKLNSKMKEDEASGHPWVDYAQPEWYHRIMKDKNRVSYLNRFF